MYRKILIGHCAAGLSLIALAWLVAGCGSIDGASLSRAWNTLNNRDGAMNTETIVAGLKEALRVGTQNTVKQTSREGGYSDDPEIRITVPDKLQAMADALRKIGLGGQVDKFEARMNRAAETAAAEATPVFIDAVKSMSFADAKDILKGNDTAATDYFRDATRKELTGRYQPIVRKAMDSVGAVQAFEDLKSRYNDLPFTPDLNYQIEDYVVEQALDGLFNVLASEEKKIRENPAARTTELLRRVFGSQY